MEEGEREGAKVGEKENNAVRVQENATEQQHTLQYKTSLIPRLCLELLPRNNSACDL